MMSCVLYIDDDYRRYQQIKRKLLVKSDLHLVYRPWQSAVMAVLDQCHAVVARLDCLPFLGKQQKYLLNEVCQRKSTYLLIDKQEQQYQQLVTNFPYAGWIDEGLIVETVQSLSVNRHQL